ncbi:hypothetical protein TCAP_06653 [Tolypocladium capitatum]|uniref:Uncharacterized protein n=1 Tax=Tolypocladium capitatum TaxID=45235 RepID=A0A2K3Q7B0_9HYPO|nr:hypothetical protein TCAP_06653 [Tolypocladium capitatum]
MGALCSGNNTPSEPSCGPLVGRISRTPPPIITAPRGITVNHPSSQLRPRRNRQQSRHHDHVWRTGDQYELAPVPPMPMRRAAPLTACPRSQPRHPRAPAARAGQEAARRGARAPDLVLCAAPRRAEQVQGLPAMRQ